MATMDMTTSLTDAVLAPNSRSATATAAPAVGIPQAVIDRAVHRGRRLRSQAIADAFHALASWTVSTARVAAGRRASTRLGCGECGDMMRA